MNGEQRREKIIDILNSSSKPVSGVALASMLNVSRQVIVQDIALIRASDNEISSTNRGSFACADAIPRNTLVSLKVKLTN